MVGVHSVQHLIVISFCSWLKYEKVVSGSHWGCPGQRVVKCLVVVLLWYVKFVKFSAEGDTRRGTSVKRTHF